MSPVSYFLLLTSCDVLCHTYSDSEFDMIDTMNLFHLVITDNCHRYTMFDIRDLLLKRLKERKEGNNLFNDALNNKKRVKKHICYY